MLLVVFMFRLILQNEVIHLIQNIYELDDLFLIAAINLVNFEFFLHLNYNNTLYLY